MAVVLTEPTSRRRHAEPRGGPRCLSYLVVLMLCSIILLLLLALALAICWVLTQGLGLDGQRTYQLAAWRFDEGARFDNTFGTWATDYGIALICGAMALRLRRMVPPSALRARVLVLLSLYAASTSVGGAVHQSYTGKHTALNALEFRLAWTFVVSATLIKGSLLWMIGSELLRLRYISVPIATGLPLPASSLGLGVCRSPTGALHIYSLPDMAWLAWGGILMLITIFGGFSYSRPACDIFVAGTSQAVPSFYVLLALLPWRHSVPARTYRLLQVGLLSNSPLIFAYPWLVQHSGLALGTINAMLHCVLAVSWTLQGIGLTYVCQLATSPVRIAGPSKMTLCKPMGSTESVSSTVSTASSLSRTVTGKWNETTDNCDWPLDSQSLL